jgi:hypothetical protein
MGFWNFIEGFDNSASDSSCKEIKYSANLENSRQEAPGCGPFISSLRAQKILTFSFTIF